MLINVPKVGWVAVQRHAERAVVSNRSASSSVRSEEPHTCPKLPDVEALRLLPEAEVPVLLHGPPGTGKSSLIEAAFPDPVRWPATATPPSAT